MSPGLLLALGLAAPAHAHPALRRLQSAAADHGLDCRTVGTALDCVPAEAAPGLLPARIELLDQLHRWDRASGSARDEILAGWVARLPTASDWALPADFAAAAPGLRLRLRHRAERVGRAGDVPGLPIGDHLVAELWHAGPTADRPVPGATLAAWGVELPTAALQAARNQGAPLVPPRPEGAVTVVGAPPDGRAADLLPGLVLSAWEAGPVLVLARTPGELVLAPLASAAGRETLLRLAQQELPTDQLLSPQPLLWQEQGWTSWEPAPGDPDHDDWQTIFAHEAAALDAATLGRLDPAQGFHGALSAVLRAGRPGTMATLVPDSATVPVADWVAVSHPAGDRYLVIDWERAAPVLAPHLAPLPDHHPPRMQVVRPLDAAAFAALAARAPGPVRPIP